MDVNRVNSQISQLQLGSGINQAQFRNEIAEAAKDGQISPEEFNALRHRLASGDQSTQLGTILATLTSEINQRFGDTNTHTIDPSGVADSRAFLGRIMVDRHPTIDDLYANEVPNPNNNPNMPSIPVQPSGSSQNTTVDLSTRESRMAALNGLTQMDGNYDPVQDGMRCAASSLVGACVMNGNDGLRNLVRVIDKRDDSPEYHQLDNDSRYQQIKAKIQNGNPPLTRGELSYLQQVVHHQMGADRTDRNPNDQGGVDINYLRDYIGTDVSRFGIISETPLRDMMSRSGMNILNVDNSVNGSSNAGNHAVLSFGGRIYDPWPRGDNNQVVPASQNEAYNSRVRSRLL